MIPVPSGTPKMLSPSLRSRVTKTPNPLTPFKEDGAIQTVPAKMESEFQMSRGNNNVSDKYCLPEGKIQGRKDSKQSYIHSPRHYLFLQEIPRLLGTCFRNSDDAEGRRRKIQTGRLTVPHPSMPFWHR